MTRRTGLLIVLTLGCLTSSCSFGMTARKYRPAQDPKGVIMRLDTAQGKLVGELIEVRDSGIIVLTDQKLSLLPYTAILSSEVDQTESRFSISNRMIPKPEVQTRLRLLSRFPQGLTPELMRQLLDAYGQKELAGTTP